MKLQLHTSLYFIFPLPTFVHYGEFDTYATQEKRRFRNHGFSVKKNTTKNSRNSD